MAGLDRALLHDLVEAAVNDHLDRRALLVGLAPALVARLPHHSAPRDQLLSDLDRLNGLCADGAAHLHAWLDNARRLATSPAAQALFARALDQLGRQAPAPAHAPDHARLIAAAPLALTVSLSREGEAVAVRYAGPFGLGLGARAPLPGFRVPTEGPALFLLLFPDPAVLAQVFAALTGAPASPDRHPVRLRIQTLDPALARAPWARLSWQGQPLALGPRPWTVEVGAALTGTRDVRFPSPARLLVALPTDLADDPYAEHLQDLLAQRQPAYGDRGAAFELAVGPAALAEAWARQRPHAVHLVELPQALGPLLAQHTPQLLYGTGVDLAGDPASAQVPVVLADHHLPAADRLAVARGLWEAVLGAGEAPHAVASRLGLSAFSQVDAWQADRIEGQPQGVPSHRRLDRFRWRSATYEHVKSLIENRARRLVGLVYSGGADHCLDHLSELLLEHLKRRGKRELVLRRLPVALPPRPDFDQHPDAPDGPGWQAAIARLGEALEIALRDALRAEAVTPGALRAAAPAGIGGRAPVLWLDFGILDDRQVPVEQEHLDAWLDLARRLAESVPPELSVLTTVSVLSEREALRAELAGAVDGFTTVLSERFSLYGLPPLEHVSLAELRDYFSDPDNEPGLDRGQADRAARVLHQATSQGAHGGNYRALVSHIQAGRDGGWIRLLDRLDPPATPRRRLGDR